MHAEVLAHLEPELKDHALIRKDASPKNTPTGLTQVGQGLDAVQRRALEEMRKKTVPVFDLMAKQIKTSNDRGQRLLGINYQDVGLSAKIAGFREKNVNLVSKATGDFFTQIKAVFTDPDTLGMSVDELREELKERAEVSESRAELIARDQILKLNSAITQARQRSAGVEKYTWSTSLDERVRDSHAELEGEVFSWDDPPMVDDEIANPGEPINCRCVALPVTADEDEDSDEDE